jgi:hypothetical protein
VRNQVIFWYNYFHFIKNEFMKYLGKRTVQYVMPFLITGSFTFCHGAGNNKFSDSINKTLPDTSGQQPIPGTPGPSGTAPSPRDTTKAFRDSLKKAHDIADSSSGPKKNP